MAIAAVLALLALAALPKDYRVGGALSALPFVVIGAIAARRQWHLPSAARVSQTLEAVSTMTWPAFSKLLEEAFRRDGYTVRRGAAAAVDFELERQGRRMLVCARRW
jgi:restriction system protein